MLLLDHLGELLLLLLELLCHLRVLLLLPLLLLLLATGALLVAAVAARAVVWVGGVAAYRKLSGNCWKSKLALRVSSPDTSRNSIVVF